jgi:anion-transporting  ArsA/GET3 family ATPase
LLERRLVIVTGKGGTGKTTVSAALGVAAAARGRRVLLVEVGRDEQIPSLFETARSRKQLALDQATLPERFSAAN